MSKSEWVSIQGVKGKMAVKGTGHTDPEAARALAVSVHAIRAWRYQGRLRYVKLGSAVRIPASEIRRVLKRGLRRPRRGCAV